METDRTKAAHAARRGTKDSLNTKLLRAQTRYGKQLGIGKHERTLARYLKRPEHFIQQKPIGPYNVDFFFPNFDVVVELVTGGGNRKVAANRKRRLAYLRRRGLRILEIRMHSKAKRQVQQQTAEAVTAFLYDAVHYLAIKSNGDKLIGRSEVTPNSRHLFQMA